MSFFGKLLEGLGQCTNSSITWHCDSCNCILNNQPGFNTDSGKWICAECGFENDVSENNVYTSEYEYQSSMGILSCPICGGHVTGDAPDATYYFNCDDCGSRFCLENGELVSVFSRRKKKSLCQNCGMDMAGAIYTSPWENGNNPDGYVKCPHCGYVNFIYDD